MEREGKKYGICDVARASGMLFVNEPVKTLFEQFEPGVHQYFPTDFFWPDGTLAQHMYMFNICNRLDTVDRKATTAELEENIMWRPDKGGKVVFNLKQIGNHHIWIDRHIHGGMYMSDALHQAIITAEFTGFDSSKRDSVSGDN